MDDRSPNNPKESGVGVKTSSALAVVPKKPDDLVEEEINSQILSILGLEDVFDLTYEEYASLLKEKAVQGRMTGSKMTTESVELVTNELKRVRGKTGRFKVKQKKININKVFDRKQPVKTGAIVKTGGLTPPVVAQDQGLDESIVATQSAEITKGLGSILESLVVIKNILADQNKFQKKSAENERKYNESQKKKEKEKKLETKPTDTAKEGNKLKAPVIGFFDAIKRFVKNILLGSVVLGLFKWLKDPSNKQAIDGFTKFLTDNAPLILGGLLAIAALPIAAKLLGLTGAVLGGVGTLAKALGSLGGLLLKIPGLGPAAGMLIGAPLVGGLATAAFAKFGAPAIMDTATKLDLGVAAAQDPLVRQAYSQLKGEGKAYKETMGRGGKKVRSEKSTSEMTAEEKKIWDAARSKESKARELAVDFSRSNQELYDLNQKLKDLQKEKPQNTRGSSGQRSQSDINTDIQNVKNQIKIKEKEKNSKKKTLYDYLKIDANKPQVQPQTPAIPGASLSPGESEKPDPESTAGGVNVVKMSHPDTGEGYGIPGVVDEQRRPAVFSKPAAEAFAKMMKDSGGKVKGSDIASSKRSPAKNAAVGGASGSKHMSGIAMDIHGSSNAWIRQHGAKYGWVAHDYAGSHGGHFEFKGPGIQTPSTPSAQIAQTSPSVPSIPSPTGGNIAMLPLPMGLGQKQQGQSGSAPLQTPVPSFSSEDPNNMTTLVVKAIYNVVG